MNPANLTAADRRAVMASFPRAAFVRSLLEGEAVLADGVEVGGTVWRDGPARAGALTKGTSFTLTTPVEEPLAGLLQTSLQRGVAEAGGAVQFRSADYATVSSLVAARTYDAAMVVVQDGPSTCWSCVLGDVDAGLARRADSGDAAAATALQRKAREEGALLPLWRARPLVAFRGDVVAGVEVNGYQVGAAWGAEEWWKP